MIEHERLQNNKITIHNTFLFIGVTERDQAVKTTLETKHFVVLLFGKGEIRVRHKLITDKHEGHAVGLQPGAKLSFIVRVFVHMVPK